MTLGTQLAEHRGKFYFVGHRKYNVKHKKLYLGRGGCFDFENLSVTLGQHWWAHSPESLAGSVVKHNNNLFSCSYFSGIHIKDGEVMLGYGINDVDCGFAKMPLREFIGLDAMANISARP